MTRALLAAIFLSVAAVGFTAVGGQRQPVLGQLRPAQNPDPDNPPPTRCPDPPCFYPAAGRSPSAFLTWVGRDVSTFWRTRISAVPTARWTGARQVVVAPGRRYRSQCYSKGVTSKTGLSYCAKDNPPTVYLPLDTARAKIVRRPTWKNWRRQDFALAYVVAHEWGHHAQKVLGLLRDREVRGKSIELQADCLAGYWAHSMWARELLDASDIREAITLARLYADAPGSPKNGTSAHGTSDERERWFNRGYVNGNASECVVG